MSAQAVGGAVGHNPVSVIVPVATTGKNYRVNTIDCTVGMYKKLFCHRAQ